MINFAELKPYITTLVLPPAFPLLCIFLALSLIKRHPRLGKSAAIFSCALLWFLTTPAVGVWLHNRLLPQFSPASEKTLGDAKIQAIVVMGGGIELDASGGAPQLKPTALDRLRHGVELARKTGLPLLVTGGTGWGAAPGSISEADVTARVAREAFGVAIRWRDSGSRDTGENATNSYEILAPLGVKRIAIVTHSWHMQRSVVAFERAGFIVLPAPLAAPAENQSAALNWLPSTRGLELSSTAIREYLAIHI